MPRRLRGRWLAPSIALAAVVAVVAVVQAGWGDSRVASRMDPGQLSPSSASVQVSVGSGALQSRPIAPGFVGLSIEYPALIGYGGTEPQAVNPVFEALMAGLAPGQSPVLRVGGDSTDWTWWPVRGVRRPPGIRYTLRPRWFAVARTLARDTGARLVLGINLESGNRRVAAAEGAALLGGIGRSAVRALELGNEPELYASFGWYKAPDGHQVPGRGRAYNLPQFIQEFTRYGGALPAAVPLAGPATGAPRWRARLEQFMRAPRLGLVSVHSYPLTSCIAQKGKPTEATIPNLLAPLAATGLAQTDALDAAIAHRHGLPLRVDELNSVSCGGKRGVSNSFAAALWSLGALFEMARVGADGINIHTFPAARYQPFAFTHVHGRWTASVKPLYYGLLMFARAAPAGSTLRTVSTADPSGAIRSWATRAPDGRTRVVLVNYGITGTRGLSGTRGAAGARVAAVRVAGGSGGPGALERLQAPGVYSTSGVTLGGQGFGASTGTGRLTGVAQTTSLRPVSGRYVVSVPAGSAVMLTVG